MHQGWWYCWSSFVMCSSVKGGARILFRASHHSNVDCGPENGFWLLQLPTILEAKRGRVGECLPFVAPLSVMSLTHVILFFLCVCVCIWCTNVVATHQVMAPYWSLTYGAEYLFIKYSCMLLHTPGNFNIYSDLWKVWPLFFNVPLDPNQFASLTCSL